MFKSFFKPKWQHANPQVRLEAISRFNATDVEHQRILEQMAGKDEDSAVRMAAYQRLTRLEMIARLLADEKDADVRACGFRHFAGALAAKPSADTNYSVLLRPMSSDLLVEMLGVVRVQALSDQILAAITDQGTLKRLALDLPLAQSRQQAAHKITDEAGLEEVARAAKGKDKSVYRIVREKLDAMKAEHDAEADNEQRILDMCRAMEAHARVTSDPQYQARYEHLTRQWQRLQSTAHPEQQQRFQRAADLCRQNIDAARAETHKHDAIQTQRNVAVQQRMDVCGSLEAAIQCYSDGISAEQVDVLVKLLDECRAEWKKLCGEASVSSDETQRFNRALMSLEKLQQAAVTLFSRENAIITAARELLDSPVHSVFELEQMRAVLQQASGNLVWPESFRLPAALEMRNQALSHYQSVRNVLEQAEQETIKSVSNMVKSLDQEIDRGNLKAANTLLRQLQDSLKTLPIGKAVEFQKQAREFTRKVNELRDWQGFATVPKKNALIEEMESLVGAELDSQVLATRIKRLQDEWRLLGGSGQNASRHLWERFNAAAEKAYTPCREYFGKLQEVREANLQARRKIVEHLQAYLENTDWEHANWNAAREILDVAKSEWRTYSPVERKTGKDVQDAFNDLLKRLQEKIDAEFARNVKTRAAIIEEVEALVNAPDLRAATERAKVLQKAWKEAGMVSPRDDGKMWRQFRAACDTLFARRDQARVDAQGERERVLADAEAICEQLESLVGTTAFNVADAQQQFRQLQDRFSEISALPREHNEKVRQRFRTACEQVRQEIIHQQSRKRGALFDVLWDTSRLLDEMEEQLLAGESVNISLDVNEPMPVGAERALVERLAGLREFQSTADREVLEINATKLKEICLRYEIIAGVESPAEEQQARMQYQINRFNKGLRQQHQSTAEQLEDLQVEWLSVGPVAVDVRATVGHRFRTAITLAGR